MANAHARRRIYVAPHFDDVALSCGGTVALDAAQSGNSPLIVTIFAGLPGEQLSEFAAFQHERWGLSADAAVQARRTEDRCAALALGASVETLWLDHLDAIYRDAAYDSDAALFGRVRPGDATLSEQLASELLRVPAYEYVVPLAIGNHVDHQIAFDAGRIMARHGAHVWAYEDIPYVLREPATDAMLRGRGVSESRQSYLNDDAAQRKWVSISCYASQLGVLFRDFGDARAAIEDYARDVGDGRMVERAWKIPATPTRPAEPG